MSRPVKLMQVTSNLRIRANRFAARRELARFLLEDDFSGAEFSDSRISKYVSVDVLREGVREFHSISMQATGSFENAQMAITMMMRRRSGGNARNLAITVLAASLLGTKINPTVPYSVYMVPLLCVGSYGLLKHLANLAHMATHPRSAGWFSEVSKKLQEVIDKIINNIPELKLQNNAAGHSGASSGAE